MLLKYKTLAITLIPLIIVLLIIGGLTIDNKSRTEKELLLNRLNAYSTLLESGDLTFETSIDKIKLTKFFNEKVKFSKIIGKNYETIYSSENDSIDLISEQDKKDIDDAFKGIETTKSIKKAKESTFIITSPLIVNNKVVAVLHQGLSNEKLNQRVNQYAIYIISFILCGILLCYVLVSILLNKVILKNIYKLKKATDEIQKGNLDTQVEINTKDEIGELSHSFNRMGKDILKSRRKLEEYNKNLEKEVNIRTAQLQKKEKQLILSNKKLEALDKKKDEFISVAAHELKTPLTSIKAFSQILSDDKLFNKKKKERKKLLGNIIRNADRLYTLILDIVDSSRISLGKLQMNIRTVNTNKLIKEAKDNLELLAKDKGLKVYTKIEKKLPPIKADRERTIQIFSNLITNAIKFTDTGSITIHAKKKGLYVEFSIEDTGSGIPKENQHLLFSRFYQVDGSFTRKYGGSGLGLSVCQGLVKYMKGKIEFTTKEGKGSTFIFTIPIERI